MMPLQSEIQSRAYKYTNHAEKEARAFLDGLEETILQTRTFLKRKKAYSEDTCYDFMDNKGWIETFDKNTEAICIKNSKWRFIFIINKTSRGTGIYCYQLFSDLYEGMEDTPFEQLIRYVDSAYSFYTDNIEGNEFVHRPNLTFFKEHHQEILAEKTVFIEPLFLIVSIKKSFLEKVTDFNKYLEASEAMGHERPKDSKDGKSLISYETKNAAVNYLKIFTACFYLTDILENKDND